MPRGFFVTGTDTGVGKTVVSAALMLLRRSRSPVRYWKPVQTGTESDTNEVARLAACVPEEVIDAGVRLPVPVSPHLAAQLAGTSITVDSILAQGHEAARSRATEHFFVVEGAGGVLVPLNDNQMMADLMARLPLRVVVVARTAVGTINHTLLTLEALRQRRLDVAFVVMSGEPDAAARQAIGQRGGVAVVELPRLAPLNPQTLASWAVTAGTAWPI